MPRLYLAIPWGKNKASSKKTSRSSQAPVFALPCQRRDKKKAKKNSEHTYFLVFFTISLEHTTIKTNFTRSQDSSIIHCCAVIRSVCLYVDFRVKAV